MQPCLCLSTISFSLSAGLTKIKTCSGSQVLLSVSKAWEENGNKARGKWQKGKGPSAWELGPSDCHCPFCSLTGRTCTCMSMCTCVCTCVCARMCWGCRGWTIRATEGHRTLWASKGNSCRIWGSKPLAEKYLNSTTLPRESPQSWNVPSTLALILIAPP